MVEHVRLNIGVLDVQGAVSEHEKSVSDLGDQPIHVKRPEDIDRVDGLIIPGGESTTISRLIKKYELFTPIMDHAKLGMPLFGTCAGLILMAKNIVNNEPSHLQLMDITVNRNSFGRQRESFETPININGIADDFPAVFIRAPHIEKCGSEVEVLAEYEGRIVAAQQKNILVTAFHPELTDDTRVHHHFREMVNLYLSSKRS